MKLKLTRSMFLSLYDLLQSMVIAARPRGIETKLLHAVLIEVYKKFYKQAVDLNKRNYTIKLDDHEACAWWMFFQRYEIPAEMIYERNIILKINTDIHQKFAA